MNIWVERTGLDLRHLDCCLWKVSKKARVNDVVVRRLYLCQGENKKGPIDFGRSVGEFFVKRKKLCPS